jgi:hypothetical protein
LNLSFAEPHESTKLTFDGGGGEEKENMPANAIFYARFIFPEE